MNPEEVKAVLRRILEFGQEGDSTALVCDDPCVGVWVEWDVLDEFIDREFEKHES